MNWNVASAKSPGSSQLRVKPAAPRELRQWIRTKLPDVGATLTWHVGVNQVTHDVELIDISAGGAAIYMAVSAPADRPVWLRLIHASIEADPIEAVSIETRLIEPGKARCRLRFLSSEALQGVISLKEERRSWTRFPALETHGDLEWEEAEGTHCVAVEIVNISGGGAAVRTDAEPPRDRPCWLSLRAGSFHSSRVKCRLVVFSTDHGEQPIARLEFQEGCPIDLFEVAVNGLG
jgi:hypothetical protein